MIGCFTCTFVPHSTHPLHISYRTNVCDERKDVHDDLGADRVHGGDVKLFFFSFFLNFFFFSPQALMNAYQQSAEEARLKKWCTNRLKHLLGFEDVEHITEYMMDLKSAPEVKEYVTVSSGIHIPTFFSLTLLPILS